MKNLRAVVFDMDGTLLNTIDDLGDCMNRVLQHEGFPVHPIEAYKHFVGDGMLNLVRRVLPEKHRDRAAVQRVRQMMEAEYAEHWADKTQMYPGIAALLDRLKALDIRMAILSNKPHTFTRVMAERYFKNWSIDPVLGARDGVARKPDPAAALEICRSWELEPGEVLYAGDTNTDMQTAHRGGLFAVGVLWGFRSKEELLASGAQRLAADPLELLRFFEDINSL